ncbi:hypothetical protein [Enterococcus sp. BWR-S5]|uniref:hypothetical protein n=1 Tax=Enterococcus sp. BWR-S5 TaxID=2787714 RepID=UPI001923AA00|nr:hypothetical protein [Enterococcus sp. BWR-S5]MBL1226303.1 hypothetical protein [Enterococcus sp. BWR-S5]
MKKSDKFSALLFHFIYLVGFPYIISTILFLAIGKNITFFHNNENMSLLMFLCFFIINSSVVAFLLNNWEKGTGYFFKHQEFMPDLFKAIVDFSTLLITYLMFTFRLFDDPIILENINFSTNTFLLMIYPLNLGFRLWEHIFKKKKVEKSKTNSEYTPHRKYK